MGKKNKKTRPSMISDFLIMELTDVGNEQKDKYKTKLSPIIEDIYQNCVMLDEEETKDLNARFHMVIQPFIEKMKEVDDTFNEIFERIGYTGSFYDGLKITEATEFDLNLVLKPKFVMELERRKRPPGFVAVRVYPTHSTLLQAPYKDWIYCNTAYRSLHGASGMSSLNPNAIRSWLHGVVARTINKIEEEGKPFFDCQLKLRESGPACTLTIMSESPSNKSIDIDLVPVLEFTTAKRGLHPGLKKNDIRKIGLQKPWFAVPKPPTADCPCRTRMCWKMSFPIQESDIINNLNFFKYTLKMIKKVRDELGIHEVASYHIKTLFLLELQKLGPEMFTRYDRGLLFMHMLESLKKALANGEIPFLWNQNCNLLGKVSRETLTNKAGQLKNFCDKIDRLLDEKDDVQLRRFLVKFFNTEKCQSDKKEAGGSVKQENKEKNKSTHAERLKSLEVLTEYISQHSGTNQSDFKVLSKWGKLLEKKQGF